MAKELNKSEIFWLCTSLACSFYLIPMGIVHLYNSKPIIERTASQKYLDILKVLPDGDQGLGAVFLGLLSLLTAIVILLKYFSKTKA